jgi:hypothetical protein
MSYYRDNIHFFFPAAFLPDLSQILTQFISLPDLAGREFKRLHRFGESMLERTYVIDAGGI